MLRALIDSMVFDAVAAEDDLLAEVDRLTRSRRLELLAAAETMAEIGAVPDPWHRRRLQRVRVLVVPPADPEDEAAGALLARLQASPGVSDEDAGIAAAAALQGVPLVTEDRHLRQAVREHLAGTPLWTWADDLGPAIARLAGA